MSTSRRPKRSLWVGFAPQNFLEAKSGSFGAFLGKRSIFAIFGLDLEISALQGWRYKWATYKISTSRRPNRPLWVGFGHSNFLGAKSGSFGTFLGKKSIFAIFRIWRLHGALEILKKYLFLTVYRPVEPLVRNNHLLDRAQNLRGCS